MILDTNAVSAMADRNPGLLNIIGAADEIMLSFVSVAEFRYGLLGSSRPDPGLQLIRRLEKTVPVFFPNEETVRHYAWISDHLKRKGRPIPQNDVWTAALARQHSLAVLSNDQHFDFVDGVQRIGW
jgi:tRNA(fMet)-specific endonuclease VapC